MRSRVRLKPSRKRKRPTTNSAARDVIVSQATTCDCRECAELLLQQLAEHSTKASRTRLLRLLAQVVSDNTYGFLLLARQGKRPVGVAYAAIILSAEHCGKVGWLEELYVAPEFRSKGVGTALLTAVIERARELEIVAIDLEVDAAHRRAEALYQRFGFRPLERSRWVLELSKRR